LPVVLQDQRSALRTSVSPWWRFLAVSALVSLPAGDVGALSLNPPRNLAEMAGGSQAVILARAGASYSLRGGVLYHTRTEMTVLESIFGSLLPGALITVQVPGGDIGGEGWFVPGSPRFREGADYLLCLNHRREELWQPVCLAYGILRREAGNDGTPLLVPLDDLGGSPDLVRQDGDPVELVAACEERPLLTHLSSVLGGRERWDGRTVLAEPQNVARGAGAGVPVGCTYFSSNGMNMRWSTFDSGGSIGIRAEARGDLSILDGGFRLVQESMELWMGISLNGVNLFYDGTEAVSFDCETGGNSRPGIIIFNDPCSELDPGTLAVGGPTYSGTHTFDGVSWITIQGWLVVVNDGSGNLGDTGYRQMLAHELGHGLGFGHVDDPNALMNGGCCHSPNATDIRCVRYTYPPLDATNQRPSPDAGGNRSLVLAGDTAPLRAAVTDDGLPAGDALTTTWRRLAGPGSVIFGDAGALETTATFGRSGSYLLGLAAHDGELLRVSQARVDVDLFAGATARATFRQNAGTYRGTTDTTLAQNAPNVAAGSASTLGIDGDDPSESGLDSQGLLRFADVFGSRPGEVPPGVLIRSATLELSTSDAGSGAVLHRMLSGWTENQSWSAFGGNGIQPGVEASLEPEATASGAEGVVRVDVSRSLEAWSAAPCSNQGWAMLPLGSDGWDFSSSEGAVPPLLTVEYASVPRRNLIALGERWSYFKGTASPPASWKDTAFPATGWLSGPTGIGYGDDDDATVLTDMRNRYATVYCRKLFEIVDPGSVGRLLLTIDYDDGFVAYLNGVEAARSATLGEPGSPVNRNTLAASRDAGLPESFRLDPALLVPGQNALAVEVHNSSLDSSDLSFLPELAAEELLLTDDAEWKFLRGSLPRPPDWAAVEFDDGSWETARGSIGFGDGDDFTLIEDMVGAYVSIAARASFVVADPGLFPSLRLSVIHDDGAVLYLNGIEVGRVNMPEGIVSEVTEALASVEPTVTSFDVPATLLVAGRNVLAASVHNSDLTSSDLSFACVLAPPLTGIEAVDCGSEFRRGDVQDDGSVDLSDALKILFHLFAGAGSLPCPDAADTDDDGIVELSDAIGILDFIFRSRPAPAAPGPSCGTDPTPDGLTSCVSARCGG